MKFTMTDKKHPIFDAYRIIAAESSDYHKVASGDLGGFISKKENLDKDSEAWVHDDAVVLGNSMVTGRTKVCDGAVLNDVQIGLDSFASGISISNMTFGNQVRIYGNKTSITVADTSLLFRAITANKYMETSNTAYIGYARFAGTLQEFQNYIQQGGLTGEDTNLILQYLTIIEDHLFPKK